jgi:hypothetical protein
MAAREPVPMPAQPLFSISGSNENTISLGWAAGNIKVDRYFVLYGFKPGVYYGKVEVSGDLNSTVLTDLLPGLKYYIKIEAENGKGVTTSAEVSTVTKPVSPAVSISWNDNNITGHEHDFTVSWASAVPIDNPYAGYLLFVSDVAGVFNGDPIEVGNNASYTFTNAITNLTQWMGKKLYFKVRAYNETGLSDDLPSSGNIGEFDYYHITKNGALANDEIWYTPSGVIDIDGDVTVPVDKLLTILPGMTVRFKPGTHLIVNGALVAEGLQGKTIKFYPYYAKPTAEQYWGGLVLNSANNLLTRCSIRYAQNGLVVNGGFKMANCDIMFIAEDGIYAVRSVVKIDNTIIQKIIKHNIRLVECAPAFNGGFTINNCYLEDGLYDPRQYNAPFISIEKSVGKVANSVINGFNGFTEGVAGTAISVADVSAGYVYLEKNKIMLFNKGIECVNSDPVAIYKNIIEMCEVGIKLDGSDALIQSNTIVGNIFGEQRFSYVCGILGSSSDPIVKYNIISYFDEGFGMLTDQVPGVLKNNVFHQNLEGDLYTDHVLDVSAVGVGNIAGDPGFDFMNFPSRGYYTLNETSPCRNLVTGVYDDFDFNHDGSITNDEIFTGGKLYGWDGVYDVGAVDNDLNIMTISCPVEIMIIAPNGNRLSGTDNNNSVGIYQQMGLGEDKEIVIYLKNPQPGSYEFRVYPDTMATFNSTYDVRFVSQGKMVELAKNELVPAAGDSDVYHYVIEDRTPSAAPQSLTLLKQNNSVVLNWSAVSGTDIKGYQVYKSTLPGFAVTQSNLAAMVFTTAYADSILWPIYYYKVCAIDSMNNISQPSNEMGYDGLNFASSLIDDFEGVSDWSEIWGYNVGAPPSGHITLTTDTCNAENTYSMKVHYVFDDTLMENVRIRKNLGGEFDYSGMNMLGFWVYGDSSGIGLQVSLGNDSGCYIWRNTASRGAVINWRGWKRFDVPLSEFETGWPKAPEGGWSKIKYAQINLNDYCYGGSPYTTMHNSSIYIDEMKLRYDPPYILADNFDDVTDWSEVWGYNVGAPPSGHVTVTSDTGVSIIGPRSVKIHYTLDDTTLPECVKMQKNFVEPLILSGYGKVGFWLYGDSSNTGFQVWLGNEDGQWIWRNSASRGTLLNFKGWRKFEVPFSEFEPGWPHAPKDGWANIKYIGFTINDNCYQGCGYNQYVNSDIYLDDILIYNGNYPVHTNIPPEPPTNLTAALVDGVVYLSWSPSVNSEDDLVGYKIYRNFNAQGDYLLLFNVANCTTYIDSSFEGTYSYVVTAYDSFGNESGRSNVAYVDITPPVNDMVLTATPLCSRVVALAWTPESLGVGEAESVALYYSTTSYPESITQAGISLAGRYGLQRAVDTLWTLNPATTYYISAFAVDWRNNWSNKGTAYTSTATLSASRKMYVSLTGRNIPPYDSPLMAGTDASNVFDSLKASVRDTILFYTSGAYTESNPCSVRVNNAIIMVQPGAVCTLARASASTDSFPMVVIKSVENVKITGLAFNGNHTAGCAVQMNSALAMSPVLSGLDIFNLSLFDNGQGWIYDGAIVFGENDQSGKILDCKIHNVPRHGIMVKDTGPNVYQGKGYMEIARCTFFNLDGNAVHFCDGKAADVNIHHNLVYDCNGGISAVDSMMNDTVMYNTITGCGKAIALWGDNDTANYCVYRYNIVWGNDSDFVFFRNPYSGKTVDNTVGLDFNFNCYNVKNAALSVGKGDIAVYPQFADTANGNYSLSNLSLCVDASNSSTAGVDITGVQTPLGYFNDLGCFESPTTAP